MTKSESIDLLEEVLTYSLGAALAQSASHLILASDPKLPESWQDLISRYAAGSAIVAGTLTVYALQHPWASARHAAVVHWGVLLGCGAAVAGLHLADHRRAVSAARALDEAYAREDRHVAVAGAPPRPPLPLPFRGRA